MLQVGKRDVAIKEVEAVGHYAIRPTFSDGHDTGIYSWDYLYDLGARQDEMWQHYLERMAEAGASRDAAEPDPVMRMPKTAALGLSHRLYRRRRRDADRGMMIAGIDLLCVSFAFDAMFVLALRAERKERP